MNKEIKERFEAIEKRLKKLEEYFKKNKNQMSKRTSDKKVDGVDGEFQ